MKKTLKILFILFGSLIGLIVAAAIVVPLVVDVDKYRPQIVEQVNQRINGKLELGKLSLSLWGQIRVQVEGLSLADNAGRKVVSVKDAYFHLPFASVLSGSPQLVFKMDKPELLVVKNKAGKLNVMSLMKTAPADKAKEDAKNATQPGTPTTPAASEPLKVPGIAARARLGIELDNALVNYQDELTGLKSQVKDLNLVARDISLTRQTELEIWADLDTKMGATFALKGPAKIVAHAKPTLVNEAFDHAELDAKVDLDQVDMASGKTFHKGKGVPFNVDFAAVGSAREVKINRFKAKFHNAEVDISGTLTNLGAAAPTGATGAAVVPPAPIVNIKVASNEIDLKPWNQLVPMLDDFDLAGTMKLEGEANGSSDKLKYQGKFEVKALTAKAPKLKAQPRIDALVEVVTDQIQDLRLTMKAPGNEVTFKGKLVSFTKPQGTFELTSPGMDLDQLIEWPPVAAKPAKAEAAPAEGEGGKGGPAAGAPVADLDATLDPIRGNPAAAGAALALNTNIKLLKAKGMKMTDIVGKLYLKDLVAGLDGFSMKLWEGVIKANFASQLKPRMPTYTFSTSVGGMQLKQAVADNIQMFKNTIVGKADFNLTGSGASFNTAQAIDNLKAKGSMKVANATFGTIDVMKMTSEAINKGIEKVAEKVPAVKEKKIGSPGGRESRYELIASDFTIDGGKFHAPNFVAKAEANQGIDLKGDTEVGLKDYSLKTTWEVIDTYNLTKARDLSAPGIGGGQVEHVLAEGKNPVRFPISAGCTCLQPCYSYTQVPEFLAKVALANMTGAATSKAKAEVQKKIESIIPKSAPPAVQNAVQGLGKKLFGH